MPASPAKQRKGNSDSYRPKIITTVGARPACLVNASVTYVGNDQIYAFGGFDQYTDEGESTRLIILNRICLLTNPSIQPCLAIGSQHPSMESC